MQCASRRRTFPSESAGGTGHVRPLVVPDPVIVIDTREFTPDEAAHSIVVKLESLGFIK